MKNPILIKADREELRAACILCLDGYADNEHDKGQDGWPVDRDIAAARKRLEDAPEGADVPMTLNEATALLNALEVFGEGGDDPEMQHRGERTEEDEDERRLVREVWERTEWGVVKEGNAEHEAGLLRAYDEAVLAVEEDPDAYEQAESEIERLRRAIYAWHGLVTVDPGIAEREAEVAEERAEVEREADARGDRPGTGLSCHKAMITARTVMLDEIARLESCTPSGSAELVERHEKRIEAIREALRTVEDIILQHGVESADAYPDGYLTSYMDTVIFG